MASRSCEISLAHGEALFLDELPEYVAMKFEEALPCSPYPLSITSTATTAEMRREGERATGGIPLWDSALSRLFCGTPFACI